MGIGTSMKETSLHYYRDPLVEVLSEDQDVNLRGIIIVGSPDKNEDKYLSAERVGVTLECARADGAVFSCNGLGNNHVDYAHAIEAAEKKRCAGGGAQYGAGKGLCSAERLPGWSSVLL